MLDLGIVFLLIWMLKNAAMDVSHAIKGTPNPRYELKKQKARAAGHAAPAQPRYGTKEWFADLLSDGLAAQTERRRHKALTKKEAASAPVDDMVDVVREPRRKPVDTREKCSRPGCHDGRIVDGMCPLCGWLADNTPLAASTPDPGPAPTPPAKPLRLVSDDRPIAPVVDLFPIYKEEITMPNISGEVTGLDPAISYAKALAGFAGEHGLAGNEGYIGFLNRSKVTGRGLTTAQEMQEAFANAQAAADRHAKELEKHKTVQEAYDVVPEAGDKAYLQGGR